MLPVADSYLAATSTLRYDERSIGQDFCFQDSRFFNLFSTARTWVLPLRRCLKDTIPLLSFLCQNSEKRQKDVERTEGRFRHIWQSLSDC